MNHKKTKIVATIGPASDSREMLTKMVEAGMNVVRLNFSHGEHPSHAAVIEHIRAISREKNQSIGILADMQGPRIRTEVKAEILLEKDTIVTVSDIAHSESNAQILLDMKGISSGILPGHMILIEDGTIELEVVERDGDVLKTKARNGGVIKNRKGVILPDSELDLDILSDKDRSDLRFAVEHQVDYVGLSFVGSAEDITKVRAEMQSYVPVGTRLPKIISKIERKAALANLESIIQATDAVMVARGDLGIEMPTSEVVLLQKRIIHESLRAAKPVIVATQMMKSMTENPHPTRAEVSDVSNAVIDHTDAVMLSEESAMGKYPVETVAMMAEIIEKTEVSPWDDLYKALSLNFRNEYSILIRSAYEMAKSFHAKAIVVMTESGLSARLLSHFRPDRELLVSTSDRRTWQEMALIWGVYPHLYEGVQSIEEQKRHLLEDAKEAGLLKSGDKITLFIGRTETSENMKLVGIQEVR
jgi:pyruvate kinase